MRIFSIILALLVSSVAAFAADIGGDWTLNIDSPQGALEVTLTLKQDGDKLTGKVSSQMGDADITGSIKDNDLTWKMSFDGGGQAMELTYTAKVDSDGKMSGTIDLGGQGEIKFTGTKKTS